MRKTDVNNQLILESIKTTDIETKISDLLLAIIEEEELPTHSLFLCSNVSHKGANDGKEISKSICIYEPEYPLDRNVPERITKNLVVLNIQNVKSGFELLIRNAEFEKIDVPPSAIVKELKSDKRCKHVIFKDYSKDMIKYLTNNIHFCLKHYVPSHHFGCCSEYLSCSDNKKCVHVNKLYARGCAYRRHLELGDIFYGKNANVQAIKSRHKSDGLL